MTTGYVIKENADRMVSVRGQDQRNLCFDASPKFPEIKSHGGLSPMASGKACEYCEWIFVRGVNRKSV